jgi:hypothetical protein
VKRKRPRDINWEMESQSEPDTGSNHKHDTEQNVCTKEPVAMTVILTRPLPPATGTMTGGDHTALFTTKF